MGGKKLLLFPLLTSLLIGGEESINIENIGKFQYNLGSASGEYFTNKVSGSLKLVRLATTISSDKKRVRVGELIGFKVTLKSFYEKNIDGIRTTVVLPPGFKYVNDSAVVDGKTIRMVDGKKGRVTFYIDGTLEKNEEITLNLTSQVLITSNGGTNKVRTYSNGDVEGGAISSNTSTVEVEVDQEETQRRGVIFGRVFIDDNGNGLYDVDEKPVAGVKIYLENGHFAITDGRGKYSLFGEMALTHVVRLDQFSAPKGGTLKVIDSRYSKDGAEVFADVKRNELYKVNFAYENVNEEFLTEVEKREKLEEVLPKEINQVIEKEELTFSTITPGDSIKSSGYFADGIDNITKAIEEIEKEKQEKLLEKFLAEKEKNKQTPKEKLKDLEKRLEKLDNTLDFMNLKNGETVGGVISVQIKTKMGSKVELFVNDERVPYKQLGTTGNSPKNNLGFFQFESINLKSEENTLRVESTLGDKKEEKEITVIYPSVIKKIELEYDKKAIVSDISKPIKFKLILLDEDNHKITAPNVVSLVTMSGSWISPQDISPTDKGLQFIVEDGEKTLEFLPPPESGKIIFEVKVRDVEKDFELNFRKPNRPLLITGILEGRVNVKKGTSGFFQETLSGIDHTKDNDFSQRAAVFATGSIGQDYNLTLSYDNNKSDEDIFFQKLKRDNYFLVLGDNSIRGYDAQSKSRLYLSLEDTYNTYLYGDYTIDWTGDEVDIGNYSRTLNGYKYNFDGEKLEVEGFYSDTEYIQEFEEIPGRDVSGPYVLNNPNVVENSEIIKIVVYDRKNPSIELIEVQPPPYTIDHDTGIIYFSTIIPQYDKDGNPLFIRVQYEVEDGSGKDYPVYGGRLDYKINDYIKIGGVVVRDEHPETDYKNSSFNFVLDGKNLGKVTYEVGETKSVDGNGKAYMVKYINNESKDFKSKMIFYESSSGFDASGSFVKPDSQLLSMNNTYSITDKDEIKAEGFQYVDREEDKTLREMYIAYKRILSETSSLEVGSKYSNAELQDALDDLITVGAKYTWSMKSLPDLISYLEYEQDINDSDGRRISLASEYKYNKYLKFYGKYDFVNNIDDTYIINRYNNTYGRLFGVEFGDIAYIKPFIEYRVHSNEEKDKEIAYGLKSNYEYSEKLKISTVFEKVETLNSSEVSSPKNKTSLILSYVYKDTEEDVVSNGSIDLSKENEKTSVLLKLGYGEKITEDLTLALQNRYFIENTNSNNARNRFLAGLAYRGRDDVYNALMKYEMIYDDHIENQDYRHISHLVNTIHNYQWNRDNILTFSLGGKYAEDKNHFVSRSYMAYLFGANWKYFVNEKIDMGINSALYVDNQSNKRYGLGLEAGYTINNMFWISIGYNFLGFRDRDFYENDRFTKGAYLRFRLKFNEGIFSRFAES